MKIKRQTKTVRMRTRISPTQLKLIVTDPRTKQLATKYVNHRIRLGKKLDQIQQLLASAKDNQLPYLVEGLRNDVNDLAARVQIIRQTWNI